ncbi:MAG: ABC transporter ATP-binding protein [Candidatus Methanomethylophilaceae archaeon]|nr:ABC transporter ATP-binding protein [Candidatus Methanomethylophilaceae archaeon]
MARRPDPLDKPGNFAAAWKRLLSFMRPYRILLIIAVALSVAGTAISLIGPQIIKDITNTISDGLGGDLDKDGVLHLGMMMVILYIVGGILALTQGFILATVSQRTASRIRSELSDKIDRVPLSYLDRKQTGDIMSRMTNDADTVGHSMNTGINSMIGATTMFFGAFLVMLYTNWALALASSLTAILGFFMVRGLMKRSQRYFAIQQGNLGAMNSHVAEVYSAHDVVNVYNGQQGARDRFDGINSKLRGSAFRSQFLSGLMYPIMSFIGNLGFVVVCVMGSIMVLEGYTTIGVVVAFMLYIRLFTSPLGQLSQAIVSMQSVAAAAERVFDLIDQDEMEDESAKSVRIEEVKGEVEFRDVHFGYIPGKEVIHGFSARIEPGQKVAIVGPTGAGKTTMVNLLMRFYEVNGGSILVDGVPIKDMRREDVHDLFCMVLQDTWLFRGTIRENIAYGRDDVTDEEIENACKAAGIHFFITTLEKGYDTMLTESDSLSLGQRQQITIARAIVDRSPLLILDEATSSVDTRTEKIIQEAMDRLTEGRTSFVIAHRLSTIRNADLILVMRDGSIIESGTHEQLLADGGFYCDLYNSQFHTRE